MYERFTDRARQVMKLANQEAQRFNHDWIGTEHIILGLIKEGTGVGCCALKNLGIELSKIRLEVEKLAFAGPEMVTMGKLPQTPRAKKAIQFAIEEASAMGHNFLGSEHLLLGLLRENDGVAFHVLSALGVTLENTRKEILNLIGNGRIQDNKATPVKDNVDEIEQWCIDKIAKLPNVKDVFGQIVISGELNAAARFVIDALSDIECEKSAHILDMIQAERFRQFNAKYGKK